jgi:hypothetical protein
LKEFAFVDDVVPVNTDRVCGRSVPLNADALCEGVAKSGAIDENMREMYEVWPELADVKNLGEKWNA